MNFLGGGIIWQDGRITAYRKRGAEVLNSVVRSDDSFGLVGSDRIEEDDFRGNVEKIAPVENERGEILRFSLIARPSSELPAKQRSNDELTLVTSYPRIASRLFGERVTLIVVGGSVEAEIYERGDSVDGGFELVQSGASVTDNELTIIEDDILPVSLCKVIQGLTQ